MIDLKLHWGQLFWQEGMQKGPIITVTLRCDNICTCAHKCQNAGLRMNANAIIILRWHVNIKIYTFKHLDLYRQQMNGHLKMNTKQGNEIHKNIVDIFGNTVRLHAWQTSLVLFAACHTHIRTHTWALRQTVATVGNGIKTALDT